MNYRYSFNGKRTPALSKNDSVFSNLENLLGYLDILTSVVSLDWKERVQKTSFERYEIANKSHLFA